MLVSPRRSRASTPPLPLRARAAVGAGRMAGALSRASGRGRGTSLPGRVALRFAPGLLGLLTRGRCVLLVSGTNGKTTTTRFLSAALRSAGPVLSNQDGANLLPGLVSALLRTGADRPRTVVLEVDERALPAALAQVQPATVVLLNLTRDQLDRTGEVTFHVRAWTEGLRSAPGCVVVANADDPLVVAAVLGARPDAARVVWVAAGQPWRHDVPLCPRCKSAWSDEPGPWRCPCCDLARPSCDWAAADGAVLAPATSPTEAALALPGRANVANAAMAAAAAAGQGVSVDAALAAMRAVTDVAGRYLRTAYRGRSVRLLLAKNPAGWAEVLGQLQHGTGPVVVAVNAQDADGHDTSWLWDVPFEGLRGRRVVAAGERAADVSLRLQYADVEHVRCSDALAALPELGGDATELVANYTAFIRIRKRLSDCAAATVPAAGELAA